MAYPGGTARQVGPSFQDPRTVRWAPDGHRFAVDTTSGTYLINDDGQSERLQADNCEMAWSPDGSQIALACAADAEGATTNIYLQPANH